MGGDNQGLLLFIVVAIPYLFGSLLLVPYVASQKGRSSVGWALIGLFLTPLLALLALAAVPEHEHEEDDQPDDAGVPEFKWRKGAD